MSRQLKFRAWDSWWGKMYYFDFTKNIEARPDDELKGLRILHEEGSVYAILDMIKIMQFTGLYDKNGKEIYEGDIVKMTGNYKPGTYMVFWDSYRVAWWLANIKQREKEYDDDFYQLLGGPWQCDIREIIGSIHENPELLESEEKKC